MGSASGGSRSPGFRRGLLLGRGARSIKARSGSDGICPRPIKARSGSDGICPPCSPQGNSSGSKSRAPCLTATM